MSDEASHSAAALAAEEEKSRKTVAQLSKSIARPPKRVSNRELEKARRDGILPDDEEEWERFALLMYKQRNFFKETLRDKLKVKKNIIKERNRMHALRDRAKRKKKYQEKRDKLKIQHAAAIKAAEETVRQRMQTEWDLREQKLREQHQAEIHRLKEQLNEQGTAAARGSSAAATPGAGAGAADRR